MAKKRGGKQNDDIYKQLSLFDILCTDVDQSVIGTIESEERSTVLLVEGSREIESENRGTREGSDSSSEWRVTGYDNEQSNREPSISRKAESRNTESGDGKRDHNGLVTETTSNATSFMEELRLNQNNDDRKAMMNEQTSIAFSFDQDEIDLFIKYGCDNTENGRAIITTEFSKDKPVPELIETLKSVYHGGFGIKTDRQITAWFDKDKGMFLSNGTYAKNRNQATIISWQEIANRIAQLLTEGKFATKIELLTAPEIEKNQVAIKVVNLYGDISETLNRNLYFPILSQLITFSFPESTNNLSYALSDTNLRHSIHDELSHFNESYQNDKTLLRFKYHDLHVILKSIEELDLARKTYSTTRFHPLPISAFITDDEIDNSLKRGSGFQNGINRIFSYFQNNPNIQERVKFLIKEYGTGGYSHALSNADYSHIDHDFKGMSFKKKNCKTLHLKWPQIVQRIDEMIKNGRYLPQKDNEQHLESNNSKTLAEDIENSSNTTEHVTSIIEEPADTDFKSLERLPLDSSFDTRLTVKEKITRNIKAIELLSDLEYNHRIANIEEKKILQQFTGWGGCPQLFNEKDSTYQAERNHLKEMLSIDEYQNARAATLTSYYTPIEVINYMYEIVQRLGFEQGRILDTSTGTGHFFGAMPENLYEHSDIYGIELDDITAKIAHQLYTEVNLINIGFENCPFPNNQFDLAISNVPFGAYQVFDKDYTKYHFNIHNYFFAKALDKVRNGGLIAFITTTETMDGNSGIMDYINQSADFLGAIRLPDNTFLKNGANTEISSDIIFLRKNTEKEVDTNANFTQHQLYSEHRQINQYFIDNPQMVFGRIEERKNQYGKYELTVKHDEKTLQEHFSEILDSFQTVYQPPIELEDNQNIYIPIEVNHSQYALDSFFIENDKLFYREADFYYEIQTEENLKDKSLHANHIILKKEKDIDKVKQLVTLSETAVQVIESQMKDISEQIYLEARNKLNKQYDDFVKEYGALHKRNNIGLFQSDSRSYLLCSLEEYNQQTKEITKSPIFTERTVNIKKEIKSVENVYDGLMCSLDTKGKIDIDFIATLYNKSSEETKEELLEKQYVFVDPETTQLILSDDYLSGNVRKKLAVAQKYNFQRNIDALTKVMPEEIKAEDITVQLGATWVPDKYVKEFMTDVFELTDWQKNYAEIQYDSNVGSWIMTTPYASSVVSDVWGVPKSENLHNRRQPDFDGYDLFECVINSKTPTIRNYWEERNPETGDDVTKSEVNVERTTRAQDLVEQLNERWEDWIFSDVNRQEDLVRRYNDLFNSTRLQIYNGSYLTFPEMNNQFQLEPYQKNAVARIMNQNTNTLLWQKVGAGKTFEMIAAGMEMKRLGIRDKILYVVPNHLLNQWENEFLKLYPNAHLLVATKRDFAKERRQIFVNKIVTGNFDAIIMPHSSFGMISVSTDKQVSFEQEELDKLKQAIIKLNESEGNGKQTKRIKILERSIKSIENRIKSLTENKRDDNTIPFEKLGIDFLFVDESHEFKNLYTYTAMQNVVGLQTASSKKAQDMYMKTKIIEENGGRICFATGTPVTNTMAELYTLQRYLQSDVLHQMNIHCFDAWAKAFGKVISSFEISIDGTQFVNRQRFAKFFNVQELMTAVRSFAEIQTDRMLRLELSKSPNRRQSSIPPIHIGGKAQIIRIEPSEALEDYISKVVARSEDVHNRKVDPSIDNMLKITSDSKKASIDLRLIDSSYPDEENGKLSTIAKKVYEIYQEGLEDKATQLVFCDSSTPKKNVPEGKFSDVYNEIKRKLIMLGIPENQIAFIHDYDTELKKEKLFRQMNDGEMRVLFGSTAKLGAGTNVQKRLLAIHHVDVPWKASDIEQQNGRAFRQGNMFKEIYEFRYVTEKSFDAYSWQIIQTKSTYDEQLLEGADGLREFEENQKSSFDYAEIKAIASGNPIIKEKFEVDNEVRRLERLKKQWRKTKLNAQDQLVKLPIYIQECKKIIETLEKEWEFLKPQIYDEYQIDQKFSFISSTGSQYISMKEAWEDVTHQIQSMLSHDKRIVGKYLDCNIIIDKGEYPVIKIKTPTSRLITVDSYNPVGRVNFIRILKRLNDIGNNLNLKKIEIDKEEKNLETAKCTVHMDFIHEEALRNKRQRQKEINQILNSDTKENTVIVKEQEELEHEREEY